MPTYTQAPCSGVAKFLWTMTCPNPTAHTTPSTALGGFPGVSAANGALRAATNDATMAPMVGGNAVNWSRLDYPRHGGQHASYESSTHQPKRLTARDSSAGKATSKLVEGALSCFWGHWLSPFP